MNENHIKTLRIENFKSIKEMDLECSRINVFVGKPNVGKSNILEAIGLYGIDGNHPDKFIRFEQIKNFFPFNDNKLEVKIKSDVGDIKINFDRENGLYHYEFMSYKPVDGRLEGSFSWRNNGELSDTKGKTSLRKVKKYSFRPYDEKFNSNELHLVSPHGNNLFTILETSSELREKISSMFSAYELRFAMDTERNKLLIQREINGLSYFIPFELAADTLQRMIFHYAAIYSNQNSVILFEEPESHAYPPYISALAETIIDDENNNQYFIATHSPFIFNKLVEKTKDISVFIMTYENYETKVKKMTDDEISELLDYGVNIFYNLNWFVND